MFRSETILVNCFNMSFGAVADMFVEIVFWIFLGELNHIIVTSDFGNDGSSGYFADFIIAFDAGGGEFF